VNTLVAKTPTFSICKSSESREVYHGLFGGSCFHSHRLELIPVTFIPFGIFGAQLGGIGTFIGAPWAAA